MTIKTIKASFYLDGTTFTIDVRLRDTYQELVTPKCILWKDGKAVEANSIVVEKS